MTSFTVGGDNNSPRLVTLCVCVCAAGELRVVVDRRKLRLRPQSGVGELYARVQGRQAGDERARSTLPGAQRLGTATAQLSRSQAS